MDLKADIIPPSELSEDDIAAWNGFTSEFPDLSVAFLSYPYALAAEKSFPNVRVCRVQHNDRPVIFFPFQFRSLTHRWFGIGERLAGDLSDYFGIVGERTARIDPRTLLRLSGLRALLFTHLDESQSDFGLSGEAPEPGHLIDFPNGGAAYFAVPTFTLYTNGFGNANPQSPGVQRNSLNGPGYRDVDVTLSKGFGLPNNRILGEAAKIEFRADVYNLFNNLNFDPTSIVNDINAASGFGRAQSALAARTVTLTARFSF